jgi:hypothetical protein
MIIAIRDFNYYENAYIEHDLGGKPPHGLQPSYESQGVKLTLTTTHEIISSFVDLAHCNQSH